MEIAIIILIIAVVVLAAKLTAAHGKLEQISHELEEFESSCQTGVFRFILKRFNTFIEVAGIRPFGKGTVIIKRYHFDDEETRDYAIRCAEELIEKLEERI